MKKAKFNTRLAIAGALVSGLLMMILVVGFTTENFADSNENAIDAQMENNALAFNYDGKCGDDKDAAKKEKGTKKAESKDEKSAAKEGKCGGDKSKADEASKSESKEGSVKSDDSKEAKCGEGKCGEGKSTESKCGEGKCGEGKCG